VNSHHALAEHEDSEGVEHLRQHEGLLWSFPAVLDADSRLAGEMLLYVFGRQRRNLGVHSRFIDGTVLEPGFELDELMAPVLALERYVEKTGDKAILERADVLEGLALVLERLQSRKHPDAALFSTFLQPTDDEIVYPYLTYDNVLVWRALRFYERMLPGRFAPCAGSDEVKAAIAEHCVKIIDGKRRYAWSIDMLGAFDVYDEPPGSLQLLAWYGFCPSDDAIFAATVSSIRSEKYAYSFAGRPIAEIGCPHAPHPWVLSIANSLLCGHRDSALSHLKRTEMDGMIACESVEEYTGKCTTGEAFATCAGFLCHALRESEKLEEAHA
jgi:meiotically up-regulated gene 157 (Mug157) protein